MAVGAGAILIGILCFFFLGKGLWRFLGCMTTFILMAVIVGVLFFFVSGSDFSKNISGFISGFSQSEKAPAKIQEPQEVQNQQAPAAENAPAADPAAAPAAAPEQQQTPLDPQLLVGLPPGAMQQMQQMPPNVVAGKITSIVSGDVFRIGQQTIRLYGLASPLSNQKCLDASGHTYDCGYVSARMLKDFVSGDDVSCRIMNINAKGELMAACSVGSFDIGAAMVEAGWAIALPAVTAIYLPYQQKAQEGRKGLWEGQFQMPWEWAAKLQSQQSSGGEATRIPAARMPQKKKGKGLFDFL